jgi:hypothetical protein
VDPIEQFQIPGIGEVRPDRSKYRVAGAGRPVNIEAEIHESLDDRGYLRPRTHSLPL